MGKKKTKSKKQSSTRKSTTANKPSKSKTINKSPKDHLSNSSHDLKDYYLWNMNEAPLPGQSTSVFQFLPAAFFTAFVIMIVRLHSYTRDMTEFYWSSGTSDLSDFFSYHKSLAIVICAALAVLLLLYRLFVRNFYIKKSILYIPALVYLAFVLLSYALSSHKDIAWMGWNDRFEGTLILMCYIFMAFYLINLVNSEKGVKFIMYPLAITSFILSLLGLSQAVGRDFFQSVIGQKLIVPNLEMKDGGTAWDAIDKYAEQGEQFLKFAFQNKEIYQTVYNINYVSFYLTLLIPIFGLLFIQEKNSIIKKIMWGILFGLLIFNLIGSASSGGLLGMFVVIVIAIIIFNKQIITWWKPVSILIVITLLVGGITFDRWSSELTGAIQGVMGTSSAKQAAATPADGGNPAVSGGSIEDGKSGPSTSGHKFEYFANKGDTIEFSMDGKIAAVDLSEEDSIVVTDDKKTPLSTTQDPSSGRITIEDDRFSSVVIQPAKDDEGNSLFNIGIAGEEKTWSFTKTENGAELLNGMGNTVKLEDVEHIGFAKNPGFGSGRGYIWSRSLPMIKDTVFVGHGADTYCIYFPHKDYIGKYNAGWNVDMVVDKPHNMYIGIAVNTGLISLIALLTFFGIYIVQSFKLYFRRKMQSFTAFAGAGIFLGICGFLISGFVDDSSLSVMPMFYGLLGTGIGVNMLLKKNIE